MENNLQYVAICNTFEKYALPHLCFYQWSLDFIYLVTLCTLSSVCPQDGDHEILANVNYISCPQRITFLFFIIIIIIIIIIHGLGGLTCSGNEARSWTPQETILVHLTWIRLRLNTYGLKLTHSISINMSFKIKPTLVNLPFQQKVNKIQLLQLAILVRIQYS
jgi:hypothetical protein